MKALCEWPSFPGQPGADPTIDRKKGFENIINKYPKIEITMSQTGEFNLNQGKQVMEAFLQAAGDEIDVVYAHNDDMAIGAIQAIQGIRQDTRKRHLRGIHRRG